MTKTIKKLLSLLDVNEKKKAILFLALLFANLLFFSMLNNFSDMTISYSKIGYNTFFTLFLFPIFWLSFSVYQANFIGGKDA